MCPLTVFPQKRLGKNTQEKERNICGLVLISKAKWRESHLTETNKIKVLQQLFAGMRGGGPDLGSARWQGQAVAQDEAGENVKCQLSPASHHLPTAPSVALDSPHIWHGDLGAGSPRCRRDAVPLHWCGSSVVPVAVTQVLLCRGNHEPCPLKEAQVLDSPAFLCKCITLFWFMYNPPNFRYYAKLICVSVYSGGVAGKIMQCVIYIMDE